MQWLRIGLTVLCAALVCAAGGAGQREAAAQEEEPAWVARARETHARFTGRPGTLMQLGDSITIVPEYWTPLMGRKRNMSPEMEAAFQRVSTVMLPECWDQWKGAVFGNEGGRRTPWVQAHLEGLLGGRNPEVALVMIGTNDLPTRMRAAEYRERLRDIAVRCTENGTVLMVSTVPPRHRFERKAAQFAEAAREVAAELQLPLVDFQAEILTRRPKDWNGTLGKFDRYRGEDVPTLISRDGVHPSWPRDFRTDYSEKALKTSGYTLRSYLTLMKYDEVLRVLGY